jgi:cytoskeletal protein RodZ
MNKKQQLLTIILCVAIAAGLALTAFFVVQGLAPSSEDTVQSDSTTTQESTTESSSDETNSSTSTTTTNSDGSTTTQNADGSTVTVKDATNGYEEVTTVDANGNKSVLLRPKQ